MSGALACNGQITVDANGSPSCSTGWVQQPIAPPFEISHIDPTVATAMFTGGFALFIVPFLASRGVSYFLKLVR